MWNYRVIARESNVDPGEMIYGIHEVYYHQDGSIHTWTVDPVEAEGSSLAEVKDNLVAMLAATEQPILVEAGDTLVERGA